MIFSYIFTGAAAGMIGAMVGLGGGIIVVPALTLLFGVEMKPAISASLVSLIATSAMSVMVYAEKKMIHYRLGLILCLATVIGSFSGSYLAILLNAAVLMMIMGTLQGAAAVMLVNNHFFLKKKQVFSNPVQNDGIQKPGFFHLTGTAFSEDRKEFVPFRVIRIGTGFVISVFAGLLSGMLGVGGGILQVPAMNLICGVPLKVATATSAFMIGFTGLAGALIFFLWGKTDPVLTGSLVIGILAGAYAGAHWAARLKSKTLVAILVIVLIVSAVRLWMKATGT